MPGRPARQAPPALVLAAVCAAVLVLPASLTGSSVALPDISAELDAGYGPLQWVVNAYNVAFATFMLASGGVADLIGRRKVFVFGTVVFGACSLVSALATNIYLLDVLRGLSGLGAAAMLTSGSAMLATVFQGAALGRAFALFGTAAGAGLALGPTTAGWLVGAFGWRGVFLSHLVVALAVLCATPFLPESRDPKAGGVDWAGTLTFTGGLFLLTLAVVEGPRYGWTGGPVLAMAAGFAVLIGVFVAVERRQRRPMVDLSLLRQPRFVALCLLPVVAAFGFVSLVVLLPSYFIGAGGISSGAAGTRVLLLTLPVLLLPLAGAWLARRTRSTRFVLALSLLLMAAGAAWLALVLTPTASMAALLGPLLLIGSGMGLNAGIIDGAAVGSVEPARAGMAAGMFNTTRLAGEAVAIAVMGAVLVTLTRGNLAGADSFDGVTGQDTGALADRLAQGDLASAAETASPAARTGFTDFLLAGYTDAFHTALWCLTGITVLGAAVVALLLPARDEAPAPQEAPETPADTGKERAPAEV
ncbi:MFS transporter [Streptomyces sp. NPDC004284]|uniref:MFS transporter n=1 Tax=Streptomyces sp. NPDC004284 TaxID=3364695 RepID=UPI00368283D2